METFGAYICLNIGLKFISNVPLWYYDKLKLPTFGTYTWIKLMSTH